MTLGNATDTKFLHLINALLFIATVPSGISILANSSQPAKAYSSMNFNCLGR